MVGAKSVDPTRSRDPYPSATQGDGGWHPSCSSCARGVPSGKKLEDRAEEIVDAYLKAGVDLGDWRALDALVNRVYGRPTEHIVTVEEPKVVQEMRALTPEQRRELLRSWNEDRDDRDEAAGG